MPVFAEEILRRILVQKEGSIMEQILYIHLLGTFSMKYGERPISLERSVSTKSMQLLQILVHFQEKGVARNRLLDMLYGREEVLNPANNLRVTAHRLKKLIRESGLPEGEYIRIEGGIYYWDAPIRTWVDTHEFDRLVEQAEQTPDEEEKFRCMENACRMYRGEFLPSLAGEEWAVLENIQYQEKYSRTLRTLSEYLKERREYEKLLELTSVAAHLYPFEEWQAVKIDCYMAMNRYAEAMKEYEDTAKLFFEELGISPSDKMIEQFKSMSSPITTSKQSIQSITSGLKEDADENGAFYCNFPSFRDSYCLVRRMIERNGQSAFLMLCTLTDGKGQPLEHEEKLSEMSEVLGKTIRSCLRRGDSYTRYSPSQFLVLLVGTNKENCGMIFDRICSKFSEHHKSWKQHLECYVRSVVEVEENGLSLRFKGGNSKWEK